MIIQPDGPQCACGNRECWEMLADNLALVGRHVVRQAGAFETETVEPQPLDDVIRLEIEGNPAARAALTETAQYLAIGLQIIVVGLNPEFVVIASTIAKAWSLVFDQLQIQMRKGILGLPFERTQVIPTSLREKPVCLELFRWPRPHRLDCHLFRKENVHTRHWAHRDTRAAGLSP